LVGKADYSPFASGNLTVAQGQTLTYNVALAEIATGSLAIFVGLDSAGNKPLAGAMVAAALEPDGAQVYSGVTDAKGWVSFKGAVAGDYAVTAHGEVEAGAVHAVIPGLKTAGGGCRQVADHPERGGPYPFTGQSIKIYPLKYPYLRSIRLKYCIQNKS
jgi:hypothetical protein